MKLSFKYPVFGLVIAVAFIGIISGCDMLSDHIWTEYIWKVEKAPYDPAALDTGLPIIRIETAGHKTIESRENYLDAVISINGGPNPEHNLEETPTTIRGRGNNTWWYPKKPYRLKFPEKQKLFGYDKAKSWVLLANHQDPTLIMNTVTFKLGEKMKLPYTNHAVHVELILNGVYEGSYVLTEQVQVGKGRVDIDEDDGFLVELDSYYDEEPKFTSISSQLPIMIKSPEDLTDPSGYDFVKDSINELDRLVFAEDFPENGYRDLIDIDTFVKFLIVNEAVGNSELSYPKSAYMYKDKGGKICLGPLWDFDGAFCYSGSGNIYFKNSDYHISMHPFFKRFFDDPVFVNKYKAIWKENYNEIRSIEQFIDEKAAELEKSQGANFTVWQWLNKPDYSTEISDMKAWWNARVTYLNTEINQMGSGL
ncbi:MAG: CotH kinase family protein [Treponema sp.]|jgi:spore coat protein CotH|nr:CotH kinase family protein [Treponema sp.]